MKERIENAFYKTIDTCDYIINGILSLKKIYVVEIYDSGQWDNVTIGTRIFLFKKEAKLFYDNITTINKCNAKLKTYMRLSGFCYGKE